MCTLLQRRRRPSLARRELETKTLVGKKKNKEASILSHSALFIYAHQILDNAIALIAEKEEEEEKVMTDPQQKKKNEQRSDPPSPLLTKLIKDTSPTKNLDNNSSSRRRRRDGVAIARQHGQPFD